MVREEKIQERSVVHSINAAAFSRPDEADLVDSLRAEGAYWYRWSPNWKSGLSGTFSSAACRLKRLADRLPRWPSPRWPYCPNVSIEGSAED